MKITDKKRLTKILSFITMADGSVYNNRGSGNCLFSITMVEDNKDFIDFCKSVLDNITSSRIVLEERAAPRRNVYKLYTPVHPFFNTLRDRIYTGNYKSIDVHSLSLLDFEALAILYMCDGCLGKYVKDGVVKSYSLTLNMCRLSYGDQLLLKKALKDKLDLEFNVVRTNRKYWTLRLRTKDIPKFIDGVRPYMLPSFNYKVNFRTVGSTDVDDDIV